MTGALAGALKDRIMVVTGAAGARVAGLDIAEDAAALEAEGDSPYRADVADQCMLARLSDWGGEA